MNFTKPTIKSPKNHNNIRTITILLIILFLKSSTLFSQNKVLSVEEKIYGLSLFWKEAHYNFINFDQLGNTFNWDSTYLEYIGHVIKTPNDYTYYKLMEKFAGELKDGHTEVFYRRQYFNICNYPPIAQHNIGRKAYITLVDSSLINRIPLGSEIIEIEGFSIESYLQINVFPYISASTNQSLWQKGVTGMLFGLDSTDVTIKIITPENKNETVRLIRNAKNAQSQKHAKISYFFPNNSDIDFKWLKDSLAYIAINNFNENRIYEKFKLLLPNLRKSKGIVLDLRRNTGGSSIVSDSILKNLSNDYYINLGWKTKEHIASYKAWGINGFMPEYTKYSEMKAYKIVDSDTILTNNKFNPKVIILTGNLTASSAENFILQFLSSKNKPILIGETTAGTTGSPIIVNLPNKGYARICTKRNITPNGVDFVGQGIKPDIEILPTIYNLLKGEDILLNKAIEISLKNSKK